MIMMTRPHGPGSGRIMGRQPLLALKGWGTTFNRALSTGI